MAQRTVIKNPRGGDRVEVPAEGLIQEAARLENELESQENDDLDLLLTLSTQRYGDDTFGPSHNRSDWPQSTPPAIGLRAISKAEAMTQRQLRVSATSADDAGNLDDELRKMAALIGPSARQGSEGEKKGVRDGHHDLQSVKDTKTGKQDGVASELEALKRQNKSLRAQMVSMMLQDKRQGHRDEQIMAVGEEPGGQLPLVPLEQWRMVDEVNPELPPSAETEWNRRQQEGHCSKRVRVVTSDSGGAITDDTSRVHMNGIHMAHTSDGQPSAPLDKQIQKLVAEVRRLQETQDQERLLNAERHQEILRLLSPSL